MLNDEIQKIWPNWRIACQIGEGQFGTVYKIVHVEQGVSSSAALKVIHVPRTDEEGVSSEGKLGEDADRSTQIRRLADEIKMMQSMKGMPNAVNMDDFHVVNREDKSGWDIYIRMELLIPLEKHMDHGTLAESEVIQLGIDICSVLEVCAIRKIIHRDIKPANIFVNDFDTFKLGDFGIAKQLDGISLELTQDRGTPNYIAPEVHDGADYDARADQYSLGLVMYRCLNKGHLPFQDTVKQLLTANEQIAALKRRLGGETIPPPVDASSEMAEVILRACAFHPSKRFANAAEMKKALLRLQAREVKEKNDNEGKTENEVKKDNREKNDNEEKTKNEGKPDKPTKSGLDETIGVHHVDPVSKHGSVEENPHSSENGEEDNPHDPGKGEGKEGKSRGSGNEGGGDKKSHGLRNVGGTKPGRGPNYQVERKKFAIVIPLVFLLAALIAGDCVLISKIKKNKQDGYYPAETSDTYEVNAVTSVSTATSVPLATAIVPTATFASTSTPIPTVTPTKIATPTPTRVQTATPTRAPTPTMKPAISITNFHGVYDINASSSFIGNHSDVSPEKAFDGNIHTSWDADNQWEGAYIEFRVRDGNTYSFSGFTIWNGKA